MKPRDLLLASTLGSGKRECPLTISCKQSGPAMNVIASTVPLTCSLGSDIHEFGVCLVQERDGQEFGSATAGSIAISVYNSAKGGGTWFGFILGVCWKHSQDPRVDLGQHYLPPISRPGQVVGRALEVRVGDDWFTTVRPSFGKRYLQNANLALQYLLGEATGDEVIAAADEFSSELTAREELEGMQRQVDAMQDALRGVEAKLTGAENVKEDLRAKYSAALDVVMTIQFKRVIGGFAWWFTSKSIRQALVRFEKLYPPPKGSQKKA